MGKIQEDIIMTGEKNRFKTTEKLWDLDDRQLKTPVHDAMILWLTSVRLNQQMNLLVSRKASELLI